MLLRPARPDDLLQLAEIYNHYVLHSPATFDLEPRPLAERADWLAHFADKGRYRLVVAEEAGAVLGYAGSLRFRAKPAYSTTVETTIYCAPQATGRGIGARLYAGLFDLLAQEDIHRIVAAYVPPNPASAALHARFGFHPVGTFTEQGYKFGRFWDVCWMERPLRLEDPGR